MEINGNKKSLQHWSEQVLILPKKAKNDQNFAPKLVAEMGFV
jgi:hypothetical protein